MMAKSINDFSFLIPRLSSYWVDLVTPVKASLARPLIDSLKHEANCKRSFNWKYHPIKLRSFEEAINQRQKVIKRGANTTQGKDH
ncbi:MAG TPA: hypothetical protein VFI70_00800 [Nitrososphaeraceae archaeon]|nr:hypothetical protein [Nitrososphaeraceae archaeon]